MPEGHQTSPLSKKPTKSDPPAWLIPNSIALNQFMYRPGITPIQPLGILAKFRKLLKGHRNVRDHLRGRLTLSFSSIAV